MALPNLTRDQAVERAALITVGSYQISLDITDGSGGGGAPDERTSQTFRSTTTVAFDALTGADTVIDIAADTIRGASLNGVDLDVSGYNESTGIPLRGLASRNVVIVDADCRYSNTGEGLHRFADPVDNEIYLYSQFETADAKRMFACFDQPDLKAIGIDCLKHLVFASRLLILMLLIERKAEFAVRVARPGKLRCNFA